MAATGNATKILGIPITGVTGDPNSNLVYANGPTLIAPILGAATATSINKLSITAPATSAILTIANSKQLTVSNTLTFTGVDGSTINFSGGGTILTSAATSLPSLSTVGTITTGVWNGTDISYSSIAQASAKSVLGVAGNATADLAPIASTVANQVFRSDAAGTGIGWGSISLSSAATVGTSVLGATNGGTAQAAYALGDLLYASGVNTLSRRAIGTAGQVLTVVGGVPAWATLPAGGGGGGTGTVTQVTGGTTGMSFTNPTTTPAMTGTLLATSGGTGNAVYAVGDLLQATTTTALARLAAVATGNVLLSGGVGVASSWGKVGLTTHVTGRLTAANFIQGNGLSVMGVTGALAANIAPIAGTANQVLAVNPTGTALTFGSINLASAATVGTSILPAANGGTGFGAGFANGQILIGNGTGWSKATLTAGFGTTITNGAGTITIANSVNPTQQPLSDASGTITWNVTNGESATVTLSNVNRILTITNPVAGRTYLIEIIQGTGGNKTISTWPTNTKWIGGPPTLSTAAGAVDMVSLYYNGSGYRALFNGNFI